MKRTSVICFLVFIVLCRLSFSLSVSGNRVLVILDDLSSQQSYSKFFNSLKERGYKLTYAAADDPTLSLSEYGEFAFDHLVLFSPAVEDFGGLVNVPAIIDFVDQGNNVLLAVDSTAGDSVREIASECGVEFDEEGSSVLDHFHQAKGVDENTISVGATEETILSSANIVGKKTPAERKPLLFKGIGQTIKENNGLNLAIVRGYDTTYSAKPNVELKKIGGVGSQTVLLSALQARNNARVIISGSLLLFSDRFFKQDSDNQYFTEEVTKWAFKERGVLRASNVTHHREGETVAPQFYTIKDSITYSVKIEEWNGKEWVPYSADDVQLEFTMLDPYVRTFLKPNKEGIFSLTFTAPDVYGVFSFKVNYHKLGYTSLSLKTIQSVIPFRHDEYERFIKTANPYYLSSISMLVGVFVLTVFLLFTK